MDTHTFENAIKVHLKNHGMSQSAVARRLGYAPDTFNKWVLGVNRMPDTVIQDFCKVLRLDENNLMELLSLAGYFVPQRLISELDETSSVNNQWQQSTEQNEKVEVVTIGGHRIILDDKEQKISIASADGLTIITLDDHTAIMSLESAGDIEVSAAGDIGLKAGSNVEIQADGKIDIKGTTIDLN